jgi:hypothetical protein
LQREGSGIVGREDVTDCREMALVLSEEKIEAMENPFAISA